MCSRKIFGSVLLVLIVYLTISLQLLIKTGHSRHESSKIIVYLQRENQPTRTYIHSKCTLHIKSYINSRPSIKTDTSKYLLPVLYNGPTNQLIGLRDAVYLAILLNRTLVLPKFYKHLTDQSGSFQAVDERLRVDILRLSSFVPVAPYSALRDECHGHFGVAFLGQASTKNYFKVNDTLLRTLNFTLSHGKGGSRYNVVANPKDPAVINKPSDLRRYYESTSKCAMLYYSYRSVGVREKPAYLLEAKHVFRNSAPVSPANIPGKLLYAMVYHRVGKPRFIEEISRDFARDVIGTKLYLAVHWRFDPDDWLRKCKWQTDARVENMCTQINGIRGEHIVEAALRHIDKLPEGRISPVLYFATPLYSEDLIYSVRVAVERMKRRKGAHLRLLTGLDLMAYLQRYDACRELNGHMEDVLASTEMQICAAAGSFMYSTHSSWSAEVLSQRVGKVMAEFDEDILRAATEQV